MSYEYYAKKYYELGLNVTCLSYLKTKYNYINRNSEKSPSHEWIDLQIRKQSLDEVDNYLWQHSVGVGCVLGYNKIVCIDIDDCYDYNFIKDVLKKLNLPNNYQWTVKSPNGFHIYVQCESLNLPCGINYKGIICLAPNINFTNKFSRIEFRFAGHIILPPSNINKEYKFLENINTPEQLPESLKPITIFQLMAYLSGNYGPYNTSPYSYVASLKINDFKFNFTQNSDFSEFLVSKDNEVLFENHRYSIDDAINIKGYESIIYLDIETNGLINDPLNYNDYPRPIQISYLEEKNNGEIKEMNFYIKHSNLDLKNEIENLTGLSKDFLQKNGHEIEQVLQHLINIIDNKKLVVIHNSDFEKSIFDSEYLKINKRNPFQDVNTFCTMKSFAKINDAKYPKLNELYEKLFHKEVPLKLHNSINDVYILRDCYKLMDLYGFTNTIF